MNNNSNFIMATLLSLGVLLGWQVFVIDPKVEAQRAAQLAAQEQAVQQTGDQIKPMQGATPALPDARLAPQNAIPRTDRALPQAPAQRTAAPIQLEGPRLKVITPQLEGTIALRGGRLDDLVLTQYDEALNAPDTRVRLLAREDSAESWHISHGWVNAADGTVAVPDQNALWEVVAGDILTPDTPVTLRYDNGAGQVFTRRISVDVQFMFSVTQTVTNNTTAPLTLYPFAQIVRRAAPKGPEIFILHEGGVGFLGEEGLIEIGYDDMVEDPPIKTNSTGGWLGLSDKYWATALIPPQAEGFSARFTGTASPGQVGGTFRADYLLAGRLIAPGETVSVDSQAFAGAKVVHVVDAYADSGIENFDLLIDWGWFYFLTKPMFFALEFFYHLLGNYGLAILLVTVVIKLLFFPLASRSYETMAKMKKLQPKMVELRETYKDDKARQQQELLKIYREENLRPLSGCMPIFLQIPVFFALYKVLFVTLDMRHQPFFGWINDLSAPDPTSLFNLFGLLPYDVPTFLLIGVWPLIMGATMFVQMQMNPPPPDPIQARIFMFLPILFTFILASFPAGLVIYWAWNNFLSILQQGFIMRRNGVDIELFNNLGFRKSAAKPDSGE